MKISDGISGLCENYLFSETARRKAEFLKREPNADIIDLGIGDVSLPLGRTVVFAMKRAAAEMEREKTFRGYSPTAGYSFLRSAIAESYSLCGVSLAENDIFISDGAKSDISALISLFSARKVLVPKVSYPAYGEISVLCGKTPIYADEPPAQDEFIIVLCSPNNPTGEVLELETLEKWVKFALDTGSVILFDAAYRDFVRDGNVVSIFEIADAKKCAVEICSFSKGAGFTGLRCGWSVISDEFILDGKSVKEAFFRKLSAEKNGVSYVTQRAAEATLLPKGREECRENIAKYRKNAETLSRVFAEKGFSFCGGENSPYIWLRLPEKTASFSFFDRLLFGAHIVGTPGIGFGAAGEGFFRFSALALPSAVSAAAFRLRVFL